MVNAVDPITLREAAAILGCSVTVVRKHIAAGRLPSTVRYQHRQLSRADIEAMALQVYDWRSHIRQPEGYWITGQRAADVLGVNVSRLNVLAGKGFIPYEVHSDGTRLYRREQLEIVAQGRHARWR